MGVVVVADRQRLAEAAGTGDRRRARRLLRPVEGDAVGAADLAGRAGLGDLEGGRVVAAGSDVLPGGAGARRCGAGVGVVVVADRQRLAEAAGTGDRRRARRLLRPVEGDAVGAADLAGRAGLGDLEGGRVVAA